MVRMQGDMAKPPEKRLNYKHSLSAFARMLREEGPSSMLRGVGPNVVRAVLMNSSQLASYDFFKAELLKTAYFEDNILCHSAASFAAGTVATTVCSPADVIKVRICAHISAWLTDSRRAEPCHECVWLRLEVDARDHSARDEDRGPDVHVERLGPRVGASPANDNAHLHHLRATQKSRRLDTQGSRCRISAIAYHGLTYIQYSVVRTGCTVAGLRWDLSISVGLPVIWMYLIPRHCA